MPPSLALLLCTAFVLFLLRLESRMAGAVSTALWIPTIWILMIASRSLGAWFGLTGHNDSGNWMDQLVLSSLTVGAIVVLARRRVDWSGTFRRHKWLFVVIAYMFISCLWSEITLVSLKRWIRELIVVIMALATMSEANPPQALASLFRRSAYILIPFSLVLIKYYPLLGRQYGRWSGIEMWTGVTSQKNQLGRLCAVSIFFLLSALYQRWRKRSNLGGRSQIWADTSILGLALYLLQGANSSTSLATLFVGVAMFLSLRWFRRMKLGVARIGLLGLLIFLIGFGASAPFLGGSNIATFSSSLGRDDTLTGRTEVWAAVLPAMKEKPLLGYGFGSFWTDARRQLYEIPTAHNGYLDILLEQGAVGLALYTIWLLSCARQLHKALAQDGYWANFAICLLFMGVVYNGTESALNTLTDHMTTVVVLACFIVLNKPVPRSRRASLFLSNARLRSDEPALATNSSETPPESSYHTLR